MAYRLEQEPTGKQAIVIDGWEHGISPSPYTGIASLKNANINTELGEVMCNYTRTQQSTTAYSGTITSNGAGTTFTWNSGNTPYVNQCIVATDNNISGFTSGTAYWIASVAGSTITLATKYGGAAVVGFGASATAGFTVSAPGVGVQSATEQYYDGSNLQYRYYMADTKNVWMLDTAISSSTWYRITTDTIGKVTTNASGLAFLNGWIHFFQAGIIYTQLSCNLTGAWGNSDINVTYASPPLGYPYPKFALVGHQNTLNFTNGNVITTITPNSTSEALNANIYSYGQYSVPGAGTYTSTVAPNAPDTSLTLTAAWASPTGVYQLRLSNGDNRDATFTNGSTNVTWTGALTGLSTTTLTVRGYALQLTKMFAGQYMVAGQTWYPSTTDTLPTALSVGTIYYICASGNTNASFDAGTGLFSIKTTATGAAALAIGPGVGTQYFNSYVPQIGTVDGVAGGGSPSGASTFIGTTAACTLPAGEIAQSLAELGNTLVIGTKGNTLYQWDEFSPSPSGFVPLAENNTRFLLTVNNIVFAFSGSQGNIYLTSGAAAAGVLSVPDYLAGIPGTASSYIEPVFVWGQAFFARGRVFFSIQDQTASKTGQCGGIYSFVPSFYNAVVGQDNGVALRLENFNSYGTYNGLATVLMASQDQTVNSVQYWSLWTSSVSSPTYGIDFSGSVPYSDGSTVVETDIIPVGTLMNKATFSQVEFKLATPLATGESVALEWRSNATSAYISLGTAVTEPANPLSGYCPIQGTGMQGLQWVQIRATLTSTSSSPTFTRLKEIRIRT